MRINMVAISVGDFITFIPVGTVSLKFGPLIRKVPPVVSFDLVPK